MKIIILIMIGLTSVLAQPQFPSAFNLNVSIPTQPFLNQANIWMDGNGNCRIEFFGGIRTIQRVIVYQGQTYVIFLDPKLEIDPTPCIFAPVNETRFNCFEPPTMVQFYGTATIKGSGKTNAWIGTGGPGSGLYYWSSSTSSPVLAVTTDLIEFQTLGWNPGPQDESIFMPPNNCLSCPNCDMPDWRKSFKN